MAAYLHGKTLKMPQNAPGSKIGWPPGALDGLKLSNVNNFLLKGKVVNLCKQLFTKNRVSNESKNTYIILVKIKEVIEYDRTTGLQRLEE